MGKQDSVFLEPLGYMGMEVWDRIVYDFPGLGSKVSFAATKKAGWGAIGVLNPNFIVLRPWELVAVNREMAEVMSQYKEVAHIKGSHDKPLDFYGLVYGVADNEFYVCQRNG